MYLDILIFAIIAAFLVYRLNAVLGTRREDDRPRPNPFAAPDIQPRTAAATSIPLAPPSKKPFSAPSQLIDGDANKDGAIENGLAEIAGADPSFDVTDFIAGAKYAFETIVTSYSQGARDRLQPLLSPKLYADFDAGIAAREAQGQTSTTEIHRIKSARILAAHLGGAMAYITVDYDVEQTTVTRDKTGVIVEGQPDTVTTVEDIWTFTRDTRSSDPNWLLIETRAAEK